LDANKATDALSFLAFFHEYLELLKKAYFDENNIKMMLIADEANYFYSLFREY
jgi:hypothetical protein